MDIFPAIDLKDGCAVRLTQGDYNRMEVFDGNPVEVARGFARQGATHLHLVDLDGAKDGTLAHYDTVAKISKIGGLFVEVGGGIRGADQVERYLSLGVGRVILGTAALRDTAFLQSMADAYPGKIAVGVDAKDGLVAVEGWRHISGIDSMEFCRQVQQMGIAHIIYTDIAKDGGMMGTNLSVYRQLSQIPGLQVTASGGISSLDEISILRQMGVSAAIVGKALYLGALSLADVLAAGEGVG